MKIVFFACLIKMQIVILVFEVNGFLERISLDFFNQGCFLQNRNIWTSTGTGTVPLYLCVRKISWAVPLLKSGKNIIRYMSCTGHGFLNKLSNLLERCVTKPFLKNSPLIWRLLLWTASLQNMRWAMVLLQISLQSVVTQYFLQTRQLGTWLLLLWPLLVFRVTERGTVPIVLFFLRLILFF